MAIKFKSKFEEQFNKTHGQQLKGYEIDKFSYTLAHTYTPDWKVNHKVYLETKGRWVTADRSKMVAVMRQHPDLIVAMIFQAPKNKITPGSTTTYADWCDKKGIIWFDHKDKVGIEAFIALHRG